MVFFVPLYGNLLTFTHHTGMEPGPTCEISCCDFYIKYTLRQRVQMLSGLWMKQTSHRHPFHGFTEWSTYLILIKEKNHIFTKPTCFYTRAAFNSRLPFWHLHIGAMWHTVPLQSSSHRDPKDWQHLIAFFSALTFAVWFIYQGFSWIRTMSQTQQIPRVKAVVEK